MLRLPRVASSTALPILLPLLFSTGCISIAGKNLADISPEPPAGRPPSIEQTVGDFSFHLDGGKMVTSNKAGRNVNQLVFERWRKQGFIASGKYVKSAQFSGKADYNITLRGHQEGDSNVVMQFLSGLTLLILPYTVNTRFDLAYDVEHVPTGRTFSASASDSFRTITELLLLPISPFAMGGITSTHNRLADHVYQQLADQGAWSPETWPDPEPEPEEPAAAAARNEPDAAARLEELRKLREADLITEDEYQAKRSEILEGL